MLRTTEYGVNPPTTTRKMAPKMAVMRSSFRAVVIFRRHAVTTTYRRTPWHRTGGGQGGRDWTLRKVLWLRCICTVLVFSTNKMASIQHCKERGVCGEKRCYGQSHIDQTRCDARERMYDILGHDGLYLQYVVTQRQGKSQQYQYHKCMVTRKQGSGQRNHKGMQMKVNGKKTNQ